MNEYNHRGGDQPGETTTRPKTPEEQERKEAESIQTEDTEQVHPGKKNPRTQGQGKTRRPRRTHRTTGGE